MSFEPKKYGSKRPEAILQAAIIQMLENYGWMVKPTHGNAYTDGWPDLFCTHMVNGIRWVEVKLPDFKGSKWTEAQLRDFPKFCKNGAGIWILTGATDEEYRKLFAKFNYWKYLQIFKSLKR